MAVSQGGEAGSVVEQAAADIVSNAGGPAPGSQATDLESFLDLAAQADDTELPPPAEDEEEEQSEESSEDIVEDAEEQDEQEEDVEDESEDEVEDEDEAEEPKSRSERRIRQLAKDKKAAESRVEQVTSQFSEYAKQMQAQNQQLVGYVQHLAGQIQAMQAAPKGPKTYASAFDELIDKTQGALTPQMQQLIAPVYQELQQLKAEREAEREAAQRTKADAEYRRAQQGQLDLAVKKIFGNQKLSPATRLTAEQTLLGIALARDGADILDVVSEAREMLNELRKVEVTDKRSKGKAIKAKNAGVPKVPRVGIKARGDAIPKYTKDQILEAGYATKGEAMRDNFARLRGVRAAR